MNDEYERKIKKISKILLESSNKMIKERDLATYIQDEQLFNEMIEDLNSRFEKIGYEIIKTNFINEIYYILTSEGIDKNLTPQMYGILAIIIGLNKEMNSNLTIEESKEIFSNVWEEITFLKENDYLIEYSIDNTNYLIPTPTAKVIFRNFLSDLDLDKILKNLGLEP
jgi:hypothetical protein